MSDHSLHTLLRALSAHSSDGVICLDGTGRPLWWNPAASRFFFAVNREAATTARRIDDLLCVDNPEGLLALVAGSHGSLVTALETLAGDVPVVLRLYSVVSERAGAFKVLVVRPSGGGSDHWPTETFQLFAALLHRVKNAFAAVKLLAQGGQIELTVTHRPTLALMQTVESCFRRIDKEVDRAVEALDTVKHLLAAGGAVVRPISPVPIVRSILDERASSLLAAGVTVRSAALDKVSKVRVDPDAVRQIVHNVVDVVCRRAAGLRGARQFTVGVEQRGDHVVLVFRDDGPPLDPRLVSRLSRGGFTSNQDELPLMVVHWIVQRYKGRVRYSCGDGAGCAIEVWLPRVEGGSPPGRRGTPSRDTTA